jgi:hypothetical protein
MNVPVTRPSAHPAKVAKRPRAVSSRLTARKSVTVTPSRTAVSDYHGPRRLVCGRLRGMGLGTVPPARAVFKPPACLPRSVGPRANDCTEVARPRAGA